MTTPIERRLKAAEHAAQRIPSKRRAHPLAIVQPGETAHDAVLRTYGGKAPIQKLNGKPVPIIIILGVNPDGRYGAGPRVEPAGGALVDPTTEDDE